MGKSSARRLHQYTLGYGQMGTGNWKQDVKVSSDGIEVLPGYDPANQHIDQMQKSLKNNQITGACAVRAGRSARGVPWRGSALS